MHRAHHFIASGQLKPLAVNSLKAMPNFPNIPPIADIVPGVELVGWFVLVPSTGTSDPIVTRMNQEMSKVLQRQEVRTRLLDLGVYTDGADTVQETGKFIKDQYDLW